MSPSERIRQAESEVPRFDPTALVLSEAPELPDPDLDRYVELYNTVKTGQQKCTLAQDYAAWEDTKVLLDMVRAAAKDEFIPGPAVERLKRIGIKPPKKWMLCSTCGGSGDGDIGYCRNCSGHGYQL